jgi:hypothetical protein
VLVGWGCLKGMSSSVSTATSKFNWLSEKKGAFTTVYLRFVSLMGLGHWILNVDPPSGLGRGVPDVGGSSSSPDMILKLVQVSIFGSIFDKSLRVLHPLRGS